MKELAELFFAFFRIGLCTFGGGYAILPVIERELITKRRWVTMEEVLDCYSIGQVTPGVIAVNTATFIGFKRKGVAGGVIATLGFIVPSMILVTGAAALVAEFGDIPQARRAFRGIRVAVGVLILDTILKLMKGVLRKPVTALIFAAAFLLSALLSLSPAIVVTAAGLGGFLLFRNDAGGPGGGTAGNAGAGSGASGAEPAGGPDGGADSGGGAARTGGAE